MLPEIRFGPWSTTLGLAAGFGALVVFMLLASRHNRAANRWLALLVAVVTLRLVPYAIGYAGFYDRYPWLSFAPFDLSLLLGPLIWLYVWRLSGPDLPARWRWHLVSGAVQFGYYAIIFVQPLAWKNAWDGAIHESWIDPIESLTALVALAVYLVAAAKRYRQYQSWLVTHVSDRDEHRQLWIRNALLALMIMWGAMAAFAAVDWLIVPLDYFNRFPLYLLFAALVLYLGLEGWRHSDHIFPAMVAAAPLDVAPQRDWAAQGRDWIARIEAEGWWREPQLSLADVARRLATNQSYLSRALNDAAGSNFNALINRMRVSAVQAALRAGPPERDLLDLAFEAGFSSKASFNRAFRGHAGMTPSEFRASQIA